MKKTSLLLIMISAFLCMGKALSAADEVFRAEPELTLPLMKQAPKIDGVIQEKEWQGSAQMIGYCRYRSEEFFPARAVYRVGTDGEKLYFSAKCETPKSGIVRNVMPRKGNALAMMDDSFEFVFVPDPDGKEVPDIYHLIINANGAKYSQGNRNKKSVVWDVSPENASKVEDGFWSFEMALPLSSFKADDLTKPLGIRLCRNWQRAAAVGKFEAGCQQTTFLNGSGAFFSAAKIAKLHFRKEACSVETLQLYDEGATDQYNLKFRVSNPSGRPLPLHVKISGKPLNSQPAHFEEDIMVKANSSVEISAAGPVLGDEMIASSVNITSPDGKTVYFRRNFSWRMNDKTCAFEDNTDGKDSSRIAVKFAYFPSYNKMHITANLSSVKNAKTQVKNIRAKILDKQGKTVAETSLSPLNNKSISDTFWTMPDLRPLSVKSGNSLYTLSVNFDGIKDGEKKLEFYRDAMEWEGNTIGKNPDIQIAPFTPITFQARTLGTIGKEHTLLDTGLWKQVKGAGKTILRDNGMYLEAVKDGKKYPVGARNFKVVKHTRTRLETTSEIVCDILKGSIHAFWEDDGMMRWKMTLTEGSADSLRLVVPFEGKIARLMHACTDGIRFNYGGIIPNGTGCVWNGSQAPRNSIIGSYVPYIFIGNAYQGIAVFGENDKGWTQNEKLSAQQIFRNDKGDIDLVLNLFASSCQIQEPRTIDIGFLGTPVKPMPENWRTPKPYAGFYGSCLCWGAYTASDDIFPRNEDLSFWKELGRVRHEGKRDPAFIEKWLAGYKPAYPEGSDADKEQKRVWRAHVNFAFHAAEQIYKDPRKKVRAYTNGRGMYFYCPSGRTYCDQWTTYENIDRNFNLLSMIAYNMDPDAAYRDFAAWWYRKMFELEAIDWIYWDDMFLQSNFSLGSSEAYTLPDGTIQPASGIYNLRELVRRCAGVMTEMGREPYNMMHMTNAALAPVSSYLQTHYDWEDSMGGLDFQSRYTRECLQAVTVGRQYGVVVSAIGFVHLGKDQAKNTAMIRSGIGTTFTHEVIWGGGGNGEAQKMIRNFMKHMQDFGYTEPGMSVWNYWDDHYPLSISGSETSSIVMARNGRAMLMVNDYAEGGEITLKPDVKTLGIKSDFSAWNEETGEQLTVKDCVIRVTLKKHDYILLRLE